MRVANRHILIVCVEFVQPLFSGNGILTQNIVRGLLKHGCKVTVICAIPTGANTRAGEDKRRDHRSATEEVGDGNEDHVVDNTKIAAPLTSDPYMDGHPVLNVLTVEVPDECWKRLDRFSCWDIIAREAPSIIADKEDQEQLLSDVTFCFGIDWSALPTIYNLQDAGYIPSTSKLIYFVFRVFTASKELCQLKDDFHFYLNHELSGMKRADSIVLLSHVDKQAMLDQIHSDECSVDIGSGEVDGIIEKMQILVPPLRQDIQCQATLIRQKEEDSIQHDNEINRHYILCNTRLSPEKNALRFAQVMNALSTNGTLERLNLTPLMIGSVCDDEYAQRVYNLLPSNSVIVNRFLGPKDLREYLQRTLLNVHPSIYDAYGMTIAEAAAFGVPSVLHGESVGATSLLREDCDEVLLGSMSSMEDAIETVENVLVSLGAEDRLKEVGMNACRRTMCWGVSDYINALCSSLDVILSTSSSTSTRSCVM